MNEFARVLHEIIRQGKKQRTFTIKKLADQAGMAASYLSNLKQGNQNPPAHATFLELSNALRHFGVAAADVQRLTDAYTRTLLGVQPTGNLLDTLQQEAFSERGPVVERLRRSIHPSPADRQLQKTLPQLDNTKVALEEGNRNALIHNMLHLLEEVQRRGIEGGRIYLTWFHATLDQGSDPLQAELRQALHPFLYVDSPFRVCHLWGGDAARDLSVLANFLFGYFGASHCSLYEVPESTRLPEYFAIEGLGFIEARPTPEDRYWIRRVQVQEPGDLQERELQSLLVYLEFLLGKPDARKAVVQTEASYILYTDNAAMQNLAEAEQQARQEERFLIKPVFSDLYKSVEGLRARLQTLAVPPKEGDAFLKNHARRREAFRQRIEQGKEYTIHARAALKNVFKKVLTGAMARETQETAFWEGEARLVKEQLFEVLSTLRRHPNIHFALSEREFPFQMALAGGKAVFAFDLPEFRDMALLKDELELMAWTSHPDLVYRLRKEFEGLWKGLDPAWRTDTGAGRQHVVNFLATESIKALVQADKPTRELWSFLDELAEHAPQFDGEAFRREQFMREQGAQDIVILSATLPCITMPVEIGPWNSRSLIRTRQSLLDAILKRVRTFHVISTQAGIETYWKTGQYGQYTFPREWVEPHFHYLHDVLNASADVFTMEIAPPPEEGPGYIEIIDRECVLLSAQETDEKEGGMVLYDKELAYDLLAYIDRHLSAACPQSMKGAHNVAMWLESNYSAAK